MSSTTTQLIREDRRDIIKALSPSQLASAKFREFDKNGDFRTSSDLNPNTCCRRFQITDLTSDETILSSSATEEEVTTTFEVVVAYPADGRFGRDQISGLEDAIRADQTHIEDRIGAMRYANYPTGLRLFQLEDTEVERGEGVYFLVSTYAVNFSRNTFTRDPLRFSIAGTLAITVGGLFPRP